MRIDNRIPIKLNAIQDTPAKLRNVLVNYFPYKEPVRLLVHAPTFSTEEERSPATVLVVTNTGWLMASEKEDRGVSVQTCNFNDTLFFELTSILPWGQLKIHFAAGGTSFSAILRFDTVREVFYRDAIDLMLNGIDQTLPAPADIGRDAALIFDSWPIHLRNEAERYRPKGQRFLAATQWPAVMGGFQRELSPAGALLVTERELVLISEEKTSPREHAGDQHHFGGIITYFPITQLKDFQSSYHETFDVLALQVHATHGGEKLEIAFPADHEEAVSEAMGQVFAYAGGARNLFFKQ